MLKNIDIFYLASGWVAWASAQEAAMGWCKSCQGDGYGKNLIQLVVGLLISSFNTV